MSAEHGDRLSEDLERLRVLSQKSVGDSCLCEGDGFGRACRFGQLARPHETEGCFFWVTGVELSRTLREQAFVGVCRLHCTSSRCGLLYYTIYSFYIQLPYLLR